jgi:hypothetical protein
MMVKGMNSEAHQTLRQYNPKLSEFNNWLYVARYDLKTDMSINHSVK